MEPRFRRGLVSLVTLLGALYAQSARADILDANFTEAIYVDTGLGQVTSMAWAPDGSNRLFLTRKGGEVNIVQNGAVLPTPFATLDPLYTGSECGVLGIAFDPGFLQNQYVYLFVTVSGSEQQIIRYTANGDVGTDKTTILDGLPTVGANHDGGGIGFGPDGKLYFSIGDQGSGIGVDDDLATLASKVGRVNSDGSVPADNPFVDGAGGNNDYIFARGFRNPFTLNFQPATGQLWVNTVGSGYEQVFVIGSGDHAGWITYENTQPAGYVAPAIKYRTNGTDDWNIAQASRSNDQVLFTTADDHTLRLGEKVTVTGVADGSFDGAFFIASIPNDTSFTVAQMGPDATSDGGSAETLAMGGCITGGAFYDGTDFAAEYQGNFFFGDFNSGLLMRATLDASNQITSVDHWSTNLANPIDVSTGPDGALYYVTHGGRVYRTSFNATQQALIVSNTNVTLNEGGSSVVTVRLSVPPAGDVSVSATASGDQDVSVSSGASLTFTAANYATPQAITVAAAGDPDTADDQGNIAIASAGLPTVDVAVTITDTGDNPTSASSGSGAGGGDPSGAGPGPSAASGATAGGGSGLGADPNAPLEPTGCGCGVPGRVGVGSLAALGVALGLGVLRRARRRRHGVASND